MVGFILMVSMILFKRCCLLYNQYAPTINIIGKYLIIDKNDESMPLEVHLILLPFQILLSYSSF